VTEIWGSETFLDPNSSRDYLRSWKERVDTLAARTQAMSEQIEQLRVSAKDGNDLAEVTIDSTGVLVDLKLSSRMHRFEPDVVARAVLTAVAAARKTAAARSREIAEATLGPDSIAARAIADRMQQALEPSDAHGGAADD
jgi:DNA-binding protein YbaB